MVTVRLSGRRSSGAVTAMPPCSACRRSSWISCVRAWGQHRPQLARHTDIDADSLHRDSSGSPGQVPETPSKPLRRSHAVPTWTLAEMYPIGQASAGQVGSPISLHSMAPSHSPGTCAARPGSSCAEQLSCGPVLHPSPPACSSGTQLYEAPTEGRGDPKLLTATRFPVPQLSHPG